MPSGFLKRTRNKRLFILVATTLFLTAALVPATTPGVDAKTGLTTQTGGSGPFNNFSDETEIETNEATIGKLIDAGRFEEAAALSRKNLAIVEKVFGTRHGQYARALNNLGWLMQSKGDYASARKLFEQALKVEESRLRANDPKLATVYNNLASLVMFQGDYQSARPLYEKALAIQRASLGNDHPDVARTLSNLAVLLDNMGNNAEALDLHQQSLDIMQKRLGDNHPDLATALNNVANACLRQGDTASALSSYERALQIREATLNPMDPDIAQSLTNTALLISQRDTDRAKKMLERALNIYSNTLGNDHPDLIGTLNELGKLAWRDGDSKQAARYFLQAAAITDRHVANVLPALSFAEQQAFLSNQMPEQLSLLLSACNQNDQLREAYGRIFKWKGLLIEGLSHQSSLRQLSNDSKAHNSAARLTAIRQQLADWYFKAGSHSLKDWQSRNLELLKQKEAAERELAEAAGTAKIRDVLEGYSLAELAKTLHEDEVLVDIFNYRKMFADGQRVPSYAAVIMHPDGTANLIDLGTADKIDAAIKRWRKQVLVRNEAEIEWQALVNCLWQPVVEKLPQSSKRVWINPDSEVARLPWQLLASANTPLMSQIDSSRELVKLRLTTNKTTAPHMVLTGGIIFAGKEHTGKEIFPYLPGTVKEATTLKALAEEKNISVKLLSGDEPTKENILAALSGAGWVHLATHGFFIDERELAPSRAPLLASGLACAHGGGDEPVNQILTAEELIGANLENAQLVTLSACETGLGEKVTGQGVLGLRSAIMSAGARCVVMSLWKVPDESTLLLMNRFYENLWTKNMPVAEALRAAQTSVRDEPYNRFKEPIHWAGWICVGEGW